MNSGFLFFFVQDKTCSSKIVLMEMEPLQTQTVHTVTGVSTHPLFSVYQMFLWSLVWTHKAVKGWTVNSVKWPELLWLYVCFNSFL